MMTNIRAVVIHLLITVGVIYQANASFRGYALGFQGRGPIAGHEKGFIDFTDPGWVDVDEEFSVTMWVKHFERFSSENRFTFSFHNELYSNWFQDTRGFAWTLGSSIHKRFTGEAAITTTAWHHVAYSMNGTHMSSYVNGVLVGQAEMMNKFRIEPMGFQIGTHTYTLHDKEVKAEETLGFHGAIDDFTFWSRALSQAEIKSIKDNGITNPSDPSLVLYYDMEPHCSIAQLRSTGLTSSSCYVTGAKRVKNLGVAGSSYDLLLGQLDNSLRWGTYWKPVKPENGKLCTNGYYFDAPRPVKNSRSQKLLSASAENLAEPSVYGCGPGSEIGINVISGSIVRDMPASGQLTDSLNVPIQADQTISETILKFTCPSEGAVWMSFEVQDETTSQPVLHQVHIWVYDTPAVSYRVSFNTGFDPNTPGQIMLLNEDTMEIFLPVSGQNLEPPKKGLIEEYRLSGAMWGGNTAAVSDFYYHGGDLIAFQPKKDISGDALAGVYYVISGVESGLTSAVSYLRFDVYPVDDIATAEPIPLFIDEDSEDIQVDLNVSDIEGGPVGITISKLPEKGKLFVLNNETGELEEITEVYNPFEVLDPVSQFVDDVVKISSFRSNAPKLGYHPMNIIGRPTCLSEGESDCGTDTRFTTNSTLEVDDILFFDRYWAEEEKAAVYVAGKVLAVHGLGGDSTYDIKMLPLQKMDLERRDEWLADTSLELNKTKCFMVDVDFPTDCDENDYNIALSTNFSQNDGQGNYVYTGVPRAFLSGVPNSVMGFYNRAYIREDRGVSDFTSSAYGDQYEFRGHNQYRVYEPTAQILNRYDPQKAYTEFIEVSFKEAVFPLDIEVGETRGAGAIVSIKALDPDGNWDSIFRGDPQKDDSARTNGKGQMNFFSKDICRPSYKTKVIRLEFDTSEQTGISDFQFVDYVRLVGARALPNSYLLYPNNQIIYKPNKDAEGEDTFAYQGTDCGGNARRGSPDGVVTVWIEPRPDPPQVNFAVPATIPTQEGAYIVRQAEKPKVQLTAIDTDTGDAPVIRKVTTKGLTLTNIETDESNAAAQSATVEFDPCISNDEQLATIEVEAEDTLGQVTTSTLVFKVQCGLSSKRYVISELDTQARVFALVMGVVGMLLSFSFIFFNIAFRNRKVVRMSSPKVNVLILAGTLLIFAYLMTFAATLEDSTGCDFSKFVNESLPNGFDLECSANDYAHECCRQAAALSCSAPVWLLTLGLVISFAPLVAKTNRISRIFNSKNMKRIVITDKDIFIKVGVQVFVIVAILGVWTILFPASVNFVLQNESYDKSTQERVLTLGQVCVADGTFDVVVGILIAICTTLVISGAYQGYMIRNVFIKQANDSRQLFISIYNVTVFGTICLVLAFTITDEVPKFYLTVSLSWLATVITIVALFIPRVVEVHRGEELTLTNSSNNSSSSPRTYTYTYTLGANPLNSTKFNTYAPQSSYHQSSVPSDSDAV